MGSVGNRGEMFVVIGFLKRYALSRSGEVPTVRKAIS